MKRHCVFFLVIFSCAFLVFSCKKKDEDKTEASAGLDSAMGESIESPAVPAFEGGDENSMMASVNGISITRAQLDRETDGLMMQFQGMASPGQTGEMRQKVRKQALENLINEILLLKEADEKGIKPDGKEVDEKFSGLAGRFPSPEEFKAQLLAAGLSEEQLRQEISDGLRIEALLKEPTAGAEEVSEDDIAAFYKDNPDSFKRPAQVQASHIMLAFKPEDGLDKKDEQLKMLSGMRGEIEKGADFAELARLHSDCPSKQRGGDLGFFARSQMPKEFDDVAFNMKEGELSEVVETQFGYHLIKLTGRREAGAVPLEEVKEGIKDFLKRQKEQKAVNDYLLALRKGAKVEYSEGMQP